MAVDQIEPVIQDFVAEGSNEVLVIKGNWGVGKTHFWRRLIQEQTKKTIGKEKYSYLSLFGVNSLDDLKRSIFTSVVDSANTQERGIASTIRNLADKVEGIPKLAEWGGDAVLEQVLFDGVENTLVCIDDLERKGEGLKIRDLLGLASNLKEERSCQVVLILNDDALDEEVQNEFGTYGEKLVDLEIEFERSPEGAFGCVFDDSGEHASILKDCVERLGIRNVRIIQRLKRLSEKLGPYLDECKPKTKGVALETLTILAWSYYGEESRSPSVMDLKTAASTVLAEEKGEWDQLVRDYGYGSFGELDRVLLNLIERGYLTEKELQNQISRIDEQAKSEEARSRIAEAWSLYHNSFDNNEDGFITELIQSARDTIDYISIQNLNNAIEMLRTLGHEDEADGLIDQYVQHHEGDRDKLVPRRQMPHRDITDQRLREKLNSAANKAENNERLEIALIRVSSGDSWGDEDQCTIAKSSPDEYYEFFKSARGKELRDAVGWCLKQGKIANANANNKAIYRNAMKALSKIAGESRLNKIRLSKRYEIDMDELSNY